MILTEGKILHSSNSSFSGRKIFLQRKLQEEKFSSNKNLSKTISRSTSCSARRSNISFDQPLICFNFALVLASLIDFFVRSWTRRSGVRVAVGLMGEMAQSKMVRRMCPHPPRPFQPYTGRPVAEGEMVAAFQVWRPSFVVPDSVCRVDCSFYPYSENWMTVSVDPQVQQLERRLVTMNNGPDIFMGRLSISDGQKIDIPYRRSRLSSSTACSPDGNLMAWPGYTHFCVFNHEERRRKTVANSKNAICGAFSPDGRYLAIISACMESYHLRIIDSSTFQDLVQWPFSRLYFQLLHGIVRTSNIRLYQMNPVNMLWSKCGEYIGVSTYHRELFVLKVKFVNCDGVEQITLSKLAYHVVLCNVANPQAYDFISHMSEPYLAVGIVRNTIRVSKIHEHKLGPMIVETRVSDDPVLKPDSVINCLRYSHSEKLLAVAMSSGIIQLLDSWSLSPLQTLQPAVFDMIIQPDNAPLHQGFCNLSFACSDNFLAAGSTDGKVRVWCLRRPVGPLIALCRTVIRSHCKLEDMSQFILPSLLLNYLQETSF